LTDEAAVGKKSGMAGSTEIEMELAGPADIAELLPLVENYHAFERIETAAETREAALAQLLDAPGFGRIWLIRKQGRPIGYIAVCFGFSIELGGREAFIDEFYIIEGERGGGIGGRMVREVIDSLKSQSFVAIHLEIDTTNQDAQRLYQRMGFKRRDKYHLLSLNLSRTVLYS
jgi:ribosomal protein S18 acetylase RimI-like enzyme